MANMLNRLLNPTPMQSQSGAMPVMQAPQMQAPQMQQKPNGMNFMRDLLAGALLSYGGAGVGPVIAGQQNRRRQQEEMQQQAQAQQQTNATKAWLKSQGREDLLPLVDAGQAGQAIQMATQKQEAPTPYTDIGKAQMDLRRGIITPEEYQSMISGAGAMDPKEAFKRESELRQEYSKTDTIKNYGVVRDYFERIHSGVQAKTGAGDIATVFSYMKMLDPASTVREGEYATASNSGGVSEAVRGLYNQVVGGGTLSDGARRQLYEQASKIYKDVEANVVDQNKRYGGIAEQWQTDPSRILMQPEQYPPVEFAQPAPAPTPQPGADTPPPPGVDPELWGAMTPQERALWQ